MADQADWDTPGSDALFSKGVVQRDPAHERRLERAMERARNGGATASGRRWRVRKSTQTDAQRAAEAEKESLCGLGRQLVASNTTARDSSKAALYAPVTVSAPPPDEVSAVAASPQSSLPHAELESLEADGIAEDAWDSLVSDDTDGLAADAMESAWTSAFEDHVAEPDPAPATSAPARSASAAIPAIAFVDDDDDDDDDMGAVAAAAAAAATGRCPGFAPRTLPADRVYPLDGVHQLPADSAFALRSRPLDEVGSSDEEGDDDDDDDEPTEAESGVSDGLEHVPLGAVGESLGALGTAVRLPALPSDEALYGEEIQLQAIPSQGPSSPAMKAPEAQHRAGDAVPGSALAGAPGMTRQRQSLRRMDARDPDAADERLLGRGLRGLRRRVGFREHPRVDGEASTCSCVCVLQLVRMVCCCIMPEWFAEEDDAVEMDWEATLTAVEEQGEEKQTASGAGHRYIGSAVVDVSATRS